MLADGLQLASGSQIVRTILDDAHRGTTLPASAADGTEFELTSKSGNNSAGIYIYVAAESAWVVKYPNNDLVPYDVSGCTIGGIANAAVIQRHLAVRSFKLKSGFESCLAQALNAPSVDTTFSITRISRTGQSVAIGSLFFAGGETVGVYTQVGSGDILFSAGELLVVKAPTTADQFISDVSFTLAGTLV